jgi:hypothetical protein
LLFAFHGGLQNFGFDWLAELWEDEELLLFEGGQLSKKGISILISWHFAKAKYSIKIGLSI